MGRGFRGMLARLIKKILCISIMLLVISACKSMAKTGGEQKDRGAKRHKAEKGRSEYYLHRDIMTTYFYVGEHEPTRSGILDNRSSSWTGNWVGSFGDVDHPEKRDGYFPEGFMPDENPFYVALPYNDLTSNGYKQDIRSIIPWTKDHPYTEKAWPYSFCKNRWIRIIYKDRVCYAQWEDVGPYETDDWQYVFGGSRPKNSRGNGAGLDISPACLFYLGMADNGLAHWQFVDSEDVPEGPWKKIVTTSEPRWN